MKLSGPLAVLLALLTAAVPARAELIAYSFQGTDTLVNAHFLIHGTLTYDPQATLVSPLYNRGVPGNLFTTTGGLTITQDNHTYSTAPSTPLLITLTGGSITFRNETPGRNTISLEIGDGTTTLFSDITSVPSLLSLSGTGGTYNLFAYVGDPILLSRGDLDGLSAGTRVTDLSPEPSSLVILATGLAGLAFASRRRRNRLS